MLADDAAAGETRLYVAYDAAADAVKIGTSRNPKLRLSNLRVGNARPVEFVIDAAASEGVEGIVHGFLKADLVSGEWFRCSPATLTVCELLRSLGDWERDMVACGDVFDAPMAVSVLRNEAERLLELIAEAA